LERIVAASPNKLSLGVELVGWIGQTLQELAGFDTLLNEFIQNADDAAATVLTVDVGTDGLTIRNDGPFENCGHQERASSECTWLDERNHKCDLHRFRGIAGGDKRQQGDTTGAFGIGFTASYAVTDRPELHSARQHWRIDPAEAAPITVLSREDPETGTTFWLPWATNPHAPLSRYRTPVEWNDETLDSMLRQFVDAAPGAMVFLGHLERIELSRNGHVEAWFDRKEHDQRVTIESTGERREWHVIDSDFEHAVSELRNTHPDAVSPRRGTRVRLAFPAEIDSEFQGHYYATLPTRQRTGLPFHVNASFFPKQDRKRLLLDREPEAAWNISAVEAGAAILAESLEFLGAAMGASRLWTLFEQANALTNLDSGADGRDLDASWWPPLVAAIKGGRRVVLDSDGEWSPVAHVLRRQTSDSDNDLLVALDIDIAHASVSQSYDRVATEVGACSIGLDRLLEALATHGVSNVEQIAAIPDVLASRSHQLWSLLSGLSEQASPEVRQRLRRCAVFPCIDGTWRPAVSIRKATPKTTELLFEVDPSNPLLMSAALPRDAAALTSLVAMLSIVDALDRFEAAAARGDLLHPDKVLDWLSRNVDSAPATELRTRCAALPIIKSGKGYAALADLYLPGDFTDPFGLAELVDPSVARKYDSFLRSIGAKELGLPTFVTSFLPRALREHKFGDAQIDGIVTFLTDHYGVIRNVDNALEVLSDFAIVPCTDGVRRRAADTYIHSRLVERVLGRSTPFLDAKKVQPAARDLFRWLGVHEAIPPDALIRRIDEITERGPADNSRSEIVLVLEYLVQQEKRDRAQRLLDRLSTESWLPARGDRDRWYRPNELFLPSIEPLCGARLPLLGLPAETIETALIVLAALGVSDEPAVAEVVAHLRASAAVGSPVSTVRICEWLNTRTNDPALLPLRSEPWLYFAGEKKWARSDEVFFRVDGLGKYAIPVSLSMSRFANLLRALGVADEPGTETALSILHRIALATDNKVLDDDDEAVLWRCWRMLNDALWDDEGTLTKEELGALPVPDRRNHLRQGDSLFFEGRRDIAESFGGLLADRIITRRLGTTDALRSAGVRDLDRAVDTYISDATERRDEPELVIRMRERLPYFGRVLDAHDPGLISLLEGLLQRIDIVSASSLIVQRALEFDDEVHESEATAEKAALVGDTLYFRRATPPPWRAIGREIAGALSTEDAHVVTVQIKDVLAAEDADELDSHLADLGFPPVEGHASEASSFELEIDDYSLDGGDADWVSQEVADEDTPSDEADEGDLSGDALDEQEDEDRASSARGDGGTRTRRVSSGSQGAGDGRSGRGTGNESDAAGKEERSRQGSQRRGRLRSYVEQEIRSNEDADQEVNEHNRAVDRAGVDAVLEYEHAAGRTPVELPPLNEGYDIESTAPDGSTRYIEVKSIGGRWDGDGVAMSRPQFEFAQQWRTEAWLYVVEYATDPEKQSIFPIRDPAGRASEFAFDDGWRSAAE
jgi:hypothetical protein